MFGIEGIERSLLWQWDSLMRALTSHIYEIEHYRTFLRTVQWKGPAAQLFMYAIDSLSRQFYVYKEEIHHLKSLHYYG